MEIETELKMYINIFEAMDKVPLNNQSRYYTDYKRELEMRIFELKDSLEHIKQHKKK